MCTLQSVLLGLSMWLGVDGVAPAQPAQPAEPDPAQLREMLQDRQQTRNQNQAALLLVQMRTAEAEEIVREGLHQTDSADVFLALTAALRLCRDGRFTEELVAAVVGGRPAVRQAAAETLAVLADRGTLLRLQALVEDRHADLAARQAALWALGRSGRKSAAQILLEQLDASHGTAPDKEEPIRRAAAEALADLSGQNYRMDLAAWRLWWQSRKDLANQRWMEERLAYQTSRSRRLEGDLERAKTELIQLHQQYYARLPAADRLGHVQTLAEHEDPAVRTLAVTWSTELLAGADDVGQRALADLLLRLCHDGNLQVQRPAVLALGRVADPRVLNRLRRVLKHGTASVRAAAAHALAQQALARVPKPGSDSETVLRNPEMVRQVVPLLQAALDDPALEVVVAAAEDLGTLGVPEAGPVLTGLLQHPSEPVRQTAAQALERIADPKVMDGLVAALNDPAVNVRFGIVGALGRAAAEGQPMSELQRAQLIARLEELLLRDADAGVRSRAATVLGQVGPPAEMSFLWRRVQSREDSRVQEKSWAAMLDILTRSASLDLLRQWDHTLNEGNQGTRRLQMLADVCDRWKKRESTGNLFVPATEALVQAQLELGKCQAAFPLIRELLSRPGTDADVDRRLRWLLVVGERALNDGNKAEALRTVREAQPFLPRSSGLAVEFEKLEKQAKE